MECGGREWPWSGVTKVTSQLGWIATFIKKCILRNQLKKSTTYSVQTLSWSANMIAIKKADRAFDAGFAFANMAL